MKEGTEWQPIDTAPKDGTVVLLWDGEGEPITGSYVAFSEPPPDGYHSGWFDRISGHHEMQPTHWMPLPAPPERPADV